MEFLLPSTKLHCAAYGNFTRDASTSVFDVLASCGGYLAAFHLSRDDREDEDDGNHDPQTIRIQHRQQRVVDVSSATCVFHSDEFGSVRVVVTLPFSQSGSSSGTSSTSTISSSRDSALIVNSRQQWWVLSWSGEDNQVVVHASGTFPTPISTTTTITTSNLPTTTLLRGEPTCVVSPPTITTTTDVPCRPAREDLGFLKNRVTPLLRGGYLFGHSHTDTKITYRLIAQI